MLYTEEVINVLKILPPDPVLVIPSRSPGNRFYTLVIITWYFQSLFTPGTYYSIHAFVFIYRGMGSRTDLGLLFFSGSCVCTTKATSGKERVDKQVEPQSVEAEHCSYP